MWEWKITGRLLLLIRCIIHLIYIYNIYNVYKYTKYNLTSDEVFLKVLSVGQFHQNHFRCLLTSEVSWLLISVSRVQEDMSDKFLKWFWWTLKERTTALLMGDCAWKLEGVGSSERKMELGREKGQREVGSGRERKRTWPLFISVAGINILVLLQKP